MDDDSRKGGKEINNNHDEVYQVYLCEDKLDIKLLPDKIPTIVSRNTSHVPYVLDALHSSRDKLNGLKDIGGNGKDVLEQDIARSTVVAVDNEKEPDTKQNAHKQHKWKSKLLSRNECCLKRKSMGGTYDTNGDPNCLISL